MSKSSKHSHAQNLSLTEILTQSQTRICSLEVSTQRKINYKILKSITCCFCSVVWLGSYNKAPELVPPLIMARELIEKGYTVILHITGRNNTPESCAAVLDYAKKIGVKNLLAIRGATPECNIPDKQYDFPHASDLIRFIKERYEDYFDICCGGFPYKHPESKNLEEDMKYLREKNAAGAKYIITQAAFSYDVYKEFFRNCQKYNVNMKIIPGVFIIRSMIDFCFLQKLCKVPTNDPTVAHLRKLEGNDKEISSFGLRISSDVVQKLLADKDFCPPHIYTMGDLQSIKDFFALFENDNK